MVRKAIPLRSLMSLAVLAGALSRVDLLGRFLQRPIIAAASVVAVTAVTNGLFQYVLSRRTIVNYCAGSCFVAWVIGQIFRDAVWLSGVLFYIPSLPACLGMALVGIRNFASGHRRTGLAFVIGSLMAAAVVVQIDSYLFMSPESRIGPPNSASTPTYQRYNLVHWNAFDGRIHWDGAQSDLLRDVADIYVFSETPNRQRIVKFAAACAVQKGEPYFAIRGGTISTVARGRITVFETVFDTPEIEVHSFLWEFDGKNVRVLCVDLASSILVARGPLLRKVNETIRSYAPDLVVGDFNAPRRSIELGRLPAGYRHAYDECGDGLSYTWPVPFPCYSIDQCIMGPSIVGRRYELQTLWSDHRVQKLEFEFNKP